METLDAVLYDFGNGHRLCDGFSKRRESHSVFVVRVEFFQHLVDEHSRLDVSVHANNSIGDGFTFGAHLAILLHLGLVVCGTCLSSLHFDFI